MTALAVAVKANLGWTHTLHRQGTHHMATDESKLRTETVPTRLNQQEMERWTAAAKAAGREKLAQWNREFVNQMLDAQQGEQTAVGGYATTSLAAIRAQGRNLNKIARALEQLIESGQLVDKEALDRIERMILTVQRQEEPNG